MNDISKRFLCSIAAILISYNISGCQEEKNDKSDNSFNPEDYIHKAVDETKQELDLYYESDTVDIENEIEKLGIINNEANPRIMYKVIQYTDRKLIERIGIVKTYVKYNINEDNKIESEYYEVYNVFNGDYLFTCDNFDNISNNEVLYLMSYGNIESLKDIVLNKGMDKKIVYSVFDSIKDKNNLSLEEVAKIYVLLVNSSNRLESNMKLKMSNN